MDETDPQTTYTAIAWNGWTQYSHIPYLLACLFFLGMLALGVAVWMHLYVANVAFVAEALAEHGGRESVSALWLHANLLLYTLASRFCWYQYTKR